MRGLGPANERCEEGRWQRDGQYRECEVRGAVGVAVTTSDNVASTKPNAVGTDQSSTPRRLCLSMAANASRTAAGPRKIRPCVHPTYSIGTKPGTLRNKAMNTRTIRPRWLIVFR